MCKVYRPGDADEAFLPPNRTANLRQLRPFACCWSIKNTPAVELLQLFLHTAVLTLLLTCVRYNVHSSTRGDTVAYQWRQTSRKVQNVSRT